MARIDLDALQQALVNILATSPEILALGFQPRRIFYEADELEVGNISNFPLMNVRLVSSDEEVTSIPDGSYETITFSVDVFTFDFTSFRAAAKLRAAALGAVKALLKANRQFYGPLQTSNVSTQTGFGQGSVEGQRGHVAVATVQVVCEAYND
jgi:hypothetical protein